MEKSTLASEVPAGPEYRQFSGKVTIESVNGHSQSANAVLVNIALESIVATPDGFGSALGMAARQYMDNVPPEHQAGATLALFMSIQRAFMNRNTELKPGATPQ